MSPRYITMKRPGTAREAADENAAVSGMDSPVPAASALAGDGADAAASAPSADGPADTVE